MDAPVPKIEITYKPMGKRGQVQVLLAWEGGSFTDQFDVMNDLARTRFLNRLFERYPHFDRDSLSTELDHMAEALARSTMDADNGRTEGSDDEILIQIGADVSHAELFRSGNGLSAAAYARINVEKHFVVYAVRSIAYGCWLRHEFYKRVGRSPSADALSSAIATLEAKALFDGPEHRVHLRVAAVEGGIAIDLCNDDWSVVVVTASGWRVFSCAESPVRFTRKKGMQPLPVPVAGGSIEELRPFVNIPSPEAWVLYVCTLSSMLSPAGPYIVLSLNGEQGSAKSTTMKRSRALIDPNLAPVRRMPRDDRDLMIAAGNAHLQAFDNLSSISPAMSDALCSLTTGGGYATRQLYTDDEEALFDHRRPVIMNGIGDVVSRPDLLDRCVVIALPPIPSSMRREERELDAAFERARPRIFGALLDGVSTALRRMPSIRFEKSPRMADFAKWCSAAEVGFGFPEGSFLRAYQHNRSDAVAITLESSAIYPALQKLLDEEPLWCGTSQELLRVLEHKSSDCPPKERHDWPKNGKGMAEALKRLAPALRASGIEVTTGERGTDRMHARLVTLQRVTSDGSDCSDDLLRTSRVPEELLSSSGPADHVSSRPPNPGRSSSEPSEPSEATTRNPAATTSSEPTDDEEVF